jgi:inorganic pyrophosphatase
VIDATRFIGQIVQVSVDRPLGSNHPSHGFYYPVNYGCLPGVPAPDGEDLDAYILCVGQAVEQFQGECIAVIHRLDDDDDKLVVVPSGTRLTDDEIRTQVHFQEQFFSSVILRVHSS